MSKNEAIKLTERLQESARSLKDELNCDTVDMQEVWDWLQCIEQELDNLKEACGEIPGIGT